MIVDVRGVMQGSHTHSAENDESATGSMPLTRGGPVK